MDSDAEMSRSPLRWCFNAKRWNPGKEQFIEAMARIQPEERCRVNQFVFKKDVKPALIGRLMLRYCLTNQLKLTNNVLIMDRSKRGKPIIGQKTMDIINNSSKRAFDFNISHQGDYVALAFDACIKVGIDTMKIEHQGSDLEIFFDRMKRQFSPNEWTFIRSTNCDGDGHNQRKQLERFMRLWSLKESYVKAEGFGITIDLQSTSFTCPTKELNVSKVTRDTRLQVSGQYLDGWVFEECLLDMDHCVSVALMVKSSTVPGAEDEVEDISTGNDVYKGTESDEPDGKNRKSVEPEREEEKVSKVSSDRIFRQVQIEEMINNLDPIFSNDEEKNELDDYWNKYLLKKESPNL